MSTKGIQNFWLFTQDKTLRSLTRAALTSQGPTPLDIKAANLLPSAAGPTGVAPEPGSVVLLDLAAEAIAPHALRRCLEQSWFAGEESSSC